MKKLQIIAGILLFFTLFSSCTPEANTPTIPERAEVEEEVEEEEEEEEEEESIDFDNILNFWPKITRPERNNNYYFEGVWGAIFHDPAAAYNYTGEVYINYRNSSRPVSPSHITVNWRSNLDGVVYEGPLENSYTSVLEKQLSKGYHTLTFEVKIGDNENYIKKDSISFSNHISLSTESRDYSLLLKWTKYEEDDFQSYLVYGEGKLIAEIDNINTLQYLHKNVRLASRVTYQILIRRASGITTPLHGSNMVETEVGKYLRVPHFIIDVAKSPQGNLIYAIVGQKWEFMDYAQDYGILILEDTAQGITIKDHILKTKRFSDMAISRDGKYLFLVSRRTEYITRVDLTNYEVAEFHVNTNEWNLQKIDVGQDYRLYVARKSPTSGDSPMYIIDGITGGRTGYHHSLYHGDIVYNNYNNKLYHNTTIREKAVYRFSVENDIPVVEKHFSPDIPYPLNFMLISENGKHIFWDKFQLDPDLNPIREFDTRVLSIDKHNQYISNGKELIDFQTLKTLYEYPQFPYHDDYISNEIFNDSGDIIFFKPYQPWANSYETIILKFDTSEVIEQ